MFNQLHKTVEKQQDRTQLSVHDWHANALGVQLQVSNLKLFKWDTCHWIPMWSQADYMTNRNYNYKILDLDWFCARLFVS